MNIKIYASQDWVKKKINDGVAAATKATEELVKTKVSFTEPQSLTDEQKAQARENIGVEADWSENDPNAPGYIKNRTHWVEYDEEKVLFDEIITFNNGEYLGNPLSGLEEGKTYKVTFDGIEYTCKCKVDTIEGITLPYIGNLAQFQAGLTDTGEPFVMGNYYAAGGLVIIADMPSGSYECGVTIAVIEETIHKIDSKFLPEGGVGYIADEFVEVFPSTQIYAESEDDSKMSFINGFCPKVNKTYKVVIDGKSTIATAREVYNPGAIEPFIILGNWAIVDNTNPSTGEDFVFIALSDSDTTSIFSYYTDFYPNYVTMSISELAQVVHKIDTKFIPAEYVTESELAAKKYLTSYTETDPTVPAWAKESTKPTYTKDEIGLSNVDNVKQYSANNPPPYPVTSVNSKTGAVTLDATAVGARPSTWMPSASDVGADSKGTASLAVSAHNTATDAHSDIRLALKDINDRLNAFFDSDDKTLDELSEIVTYITSNKALIDSITTSKVSVSDIVNNLTTNVSNKPLSAAQGVVLKGLIDTLNNGKLDASALSEAINTALAQAKASGEFDGKDGATGETGATGVGIKSITIQEVS